VKKYEEQLRLLTGIYHAMPPASLCTNIQDDQKHHVTKKVDDLRRMCMCVQVWGV
jgi:hypothetical protein